MSAGTDNGQSLSKNTSISIPEEQPESNDILREDAQRALFQQMNSPNYLHTVSLAELYDTAYQPREQIVDDLLCSGVYLFVGAPKVGKSFFMAQLSYHVGCGLPLWEYAVQKGTVLYLALEDNYARLQKRLSRMFGMETTEGLHLATQAKNVKDGLDGQLRQFIEQHPDTKLVIIDTLQKVREVAGEGYSYGSDYEIVTKMKQFADAHNLCVLLVHHTRKQSAKDCFETISGTNGLLGAADGAFILHKKKRTDNKAVLEIVGRDQQDQRLHLLFDQEHCAWQLTKTETELWKEPPDPLLLEVAKLLTPTAPEWMGSASQLADKLKGIDLQSNVLTRRLNVAADRLWNEHSIRLNTSRTHAGRMVTLTLWSPGKRDDGDGCDDIEGR